MALNPSRCTVVWFRQDLRLSDHAALRAAVRRGPVVPVFIWSPEEEGCWPPGAASRWWLHQSLARLSESLRRVGSRLILRPGPTLAALSALVQQTGATAVYWSRRYEPAARRLEEQVQKSLHQRGVAAEGFAGALLFDPDRIRTQARRPYQVFSGFWRRCRQEPEPGRPRPAPRVIHAPARWPASVELGDFGLEPAIDWAGGFRRFWEPGEEGARKRLRWFAAEGLATYASDRDLPDRDGTSRLSPHLHFGEISPRQVWAAIQPRARSEGSFEAADCYLSELAWREFAHYLLVHFPEAADRPLRPEFDRFPWSTDPRLLRAWQRGRTGYPIVDAGMRQLWQTGWMHNRVRMIVASFLAKDLLIPWQTGAAWFWDTLVDADLANNTVGWQWAAGCGADAAPFFRIFNPVRQGERFDPQGAYVRRWVPELAGLPARWIHRPWIAPPSVQRDAGLRLGVTYPKPIVDHAEARLRALAAFRSLAESPG